MCTFKYCHLSIKVFQKLSSMVTCLMAVTKYLRKKPSRRSVYFESAVHLGWKSM